MTFIHSISTCLLSSSSLPGSFLRTRCVTMSRVMEFTFLSGEINYKWLNKWTRKFQVMSTWRKLKQSGMLENNCSRGHGDFLLRSWEAILSDKTFLAMQRSWETASLASAKALRPLSLAHPWNRKLVTMTGAQGERGWRWMWGSGQGAFHIMTCRGMGVQIESKCNVQPSRGEGVKERNG